MSIYNIPNNNTINKKKYKKALSPFQKLDAGNVEYNVSMFNKATDTGAVPSSAEGMSGIAEEYLSRDELIARIVACGKNYKFYKYTDS